MKESHSFNSKPVHPASLIKRMIVGGVAGLIVILFFILQADEPHPDWGKLWMVKPLLITPLAGATGGAFYFFMDSMRYRGGWKKILANAISLIVFIIGLWLGIVLGLNGTMWN